MPTDIESVARAGLAGLSGSGTPPGELDLGLDLAHDYGLTSLKKVMLLTGVCEELGVELSRFTEDDLARLATLGDLVAVLTRHLPQEA
ncbi:acyl carrier protein [Actinomadura sp. KC06]|uniref:acyl carrier protein n=1 Tax=Actinomadura sp. KC06 TaxID=2530369 RepID=UPI0010492CA3|nr:acyl carrier protein [Actinomadura sp. KC06]TDD34948.1 acyl carrier protein [Actinomadura sp. KC06]